MENIKKRKEIIMDYNEGGMVFGKAGRPSWAGQASFDIAVAFSIFIGGDGDETEERANLKLIRMFASIEREIKRPLSQDEKRNFLQSAVDYANAKPETQEREKAKKNIYCLEFLDREK